MTTRTEFFARLRGEMGKTGGLVPASVPARPPAPVRVTETIRRELVERWPETLDRFRTEFERVGGLFHRVARLDEVRYLVSALARERGFQRVITWHPAALGADLTGGLQATGLDAEAMPPAALDSPDERQRLRDRIAAAEIGVTGVDLAIAQTGTLILISGPGRPRSTALLPACHVAVLDRTVLVESLEQAGVFLEAWHAGETGPGGAIHFITGPSRTADIELTLTRGVHGPKEVHAIFVDDHPPSEPTRPVRG